MVLKETNNVRTDGVVSNDKEGKLIYLNEK